MKEGKKGKGEGDKIMRRRNKIKEAKLKWYGRDEEEMKGRRGKREIKDKKGEKKKKRAKRKK